MPIERLKFSESRIRSLRAQAALGRVEYQDADEPALRLRVSPTSASFYVLKRAAGGPMVRTLLGKADDLSVDAARKLAKVRVAQLVQGQNPNDAKRARKVEAQRKAATFGDLMTAYAESLKRAKKPSAAGVEREIAGTIKTATPALWRKSAVDVEIDDLLRPVKKLVAAEKWRQAEKTRSYIRAAYAAAASAKGNPNASDLFAPFLGLPNIGRDLATVDRPKISGDLFDDDLNDDAVLASGLSDDDMDAAALDAADKRPLTQQELAAYWTRIANLQGERGAALRFHLLTGAQRAPMLARLTRRTGKFVLLSDIKGRRKKARRHVIPLTADAEAALLALRTAKPSGPFLFSLTNGATGCGYHALRREVLAIAAQMVKAGEVADTFTPGSLRATVETRLQAAGVSEQVRGHLQSHGLGGIQNKHYAHHAFTAEKRAALELLRQLCEPVPSNVTPIGDRQRKAVA